MDKVVDEAWDNSGLSTPVGSAVRGKVQHTPPCAQLVHHRFSRN